jgi:hypothetical protein
MKKKKKEDFDSLLRKRGKGKRTFLYFKNKKI